MVFLKAMNIPDHSSFLKTLTKTFTPVLRGGFGVDDYVAIDLSVNNPELDGVNTASAKAIETYIQHKLDQKGATIGYGGYLEQRAIYDRSTHFKTLNNTLQRNIHLGIDFWCDAGTPVIAPLEGTVHSFKDNQNYGDYGPCVLLMHRFKHNPETSQELIFYTLYGHLDRESLTDLKRGTVLKAGEPFANLGATTVNGDYAPHLHFQLIIDISQYEGDYPGVSSRNDLPYFKGNCPDPNLILKIVD